MTILRTLNPFLYWAQNEQNVYLKVDLMNVQDPKINIETKSLEFECQGTGAHGNNRYSFHLDFYDKLNTDKTKFNILDKHVTFLLVKAECDWWPRLISQPQKPHWLKIDFDKWQSPEDMNDNEQVGDLLTDHAGILDRLQKEEIGYRKEDSRLVYLTCYNFIMYLGFLYVCVVLSMKVLKDGNDFFPKSFETVGSVMYILQAVQFLEVVHPILGIMKGGALMPLLQTVGRGFILFFMLGCEPRVQVEPVTFFLFFVWSAIEIIRYPYYISQLYKKDNKILTWLRYNAWIVFYPLGYCCEMIILYKNLILIDQSRKWSMELPNAFNFIFNFAFALRIYMLFIITPGIITLMAHMNKARRQKFSSKGKLKQK
ncbi:hypothetical protein WA026_007610 [Henosepilachna vigintioctopunctata]|uniref:Very-long-chain (3R)-3-hydroxyacyl-CoA dehydratase n=1 Tax=Henosepilachna vigintioctopunctata TaxID=420089 RepID=A0AAW1UXM9_9CUCU